VRRVLVLGIALLFIGGFAALTLIATAEQGFTVASLVAVLILVLLGVGIVGALRNPPR
jgi:FtsH-binding integral membrane protein